jgi:hypothetical protein
LAFAACTFFVVAVAFLTVVADLGLPTAFLPAVVPVPVVDLVVVDLLGCFFVVVFVGLAAAFPCLGVVLVAGFVEGFVVVDLVVVDLGLAGLF